jgi:hypothetical protein
VCDGRRDPAWIGTIWGHGGSPVDLMYYWPRRHVVMVGTLNQIDSRQNLYEFVASVTTTVRDVVPA